MNYISTRGQSAPMGFQDAVMTGMSRDGGLLIPDHIPAISVGQLRDWADLGYTDLAFEVMKLYTDLPEADLRELIEKSYSTFRSQETTPIAAVGDIHILELFHGPTLAFKDVALQFLGNMFEYILKRTKQELNILAATSGDTGSAAIYGVRGKDRIRIFVMHPAGRVSPVQERQMTSVLDDNVYNLAIEGTFDDCQFILKETFGDLEFKDQYAMGTVNSINWARVLAQIVYYFYGVLKLQKSTGAKSIQVSVPTGNFGDIFADYVAKQMGLPVDKLIIATNSSDILTRTLECGRYETTGVDATSSPSMDIQVSSNFERLLFDASDRDSEYIKRSMSSLGQSGAFSLGDKVHQTIEADFLAGRAGAADVDHTIREVLSSSGYLLDPHTAVGVHVARQTKTTSPQIVLATAHPAKFPDAVKAACGKHPELPDRSAHLMQVTERFTVIKNDLDTLENYITAFACRRIKSAGTLRR